MTTPFNYVTFNDQVSFADDGEQRVYHGPDDFDAAAWGDAKSMEQAKAFCVSWMESFDIEDTRYDVQFWDGRTMVVLFADAETVSVITFIFEV